MDCTLVVAVDESHLPSLQLVWPTWKKYRPELLRWPMLLIVDATTNLTAWHKQVEFVDHPELKLIPWSMPHVEQREKMLSALVFVPAEHVATKWYLKLDVDVVATAGTVSYRPEWFEADAHGRSPAFVTSPWSYTKPAEWIEQLENWGDSHAILGNFPRLGLCSEVGARCLRHPRIASWCFFGNTTWTKMVSAYAGGKLPVPSQDTYLWYCAARRGDFYRTARMRQMGWQYTVSRRSASRLICQAINTTVPNTQVEVLASPGVAHKQATKGTGMPRRHARVLARLISRWHGKPICGAELGVWQGQTSEYLLRTYPELFLYMVDSWQAYDVRCACSQSGSMFAQQTWSDHAASLREAVARTRFAANQRQVLRASTTDASARIATESLDFVFVDADHTYDAVMGDLENWWPKIKPGGILCGHDYGCRLDRRGKWGVSRAVDEFAAKRGLVVNLAGAMVWWIEKSLNSTSQQPCRSIAPLPKGQPALHALPSQRAPNIERCDVPQGIVYLLTDVPHAARLAVSLFSLRKFYSGPITLFTTRPQSHRIGQLCAADHRLRIAHQPVNELRTRRNSSLLTKVAVLPESPYRVTLFLDADTLVVGDISDLFQLGEDQLILVPQFGQWLSNGRRIQRRIQRWATVNAGNEHSAEIPRLMAQSLHANPAINIGVFAYRRPSPLLNRWLELTRKGIRTFIPDEIALQLLLPDYSHRVIDCRFNCSPVHARDTQDVRIWHFHGDKHLTPTGRSLWWPTFAECWQENVAEIQSWAPANDRQLEKVLHKSSLR